MATRLRSVVLFFCTLLMVGCDTIGADSADYEALNPIPADFGFRAIYGLNDSADFDSILEIAAILVYDENDAPTSSSDERVKTRINGVPLASEAFAFDYQPGASYTLEVGYDGQRVSGTVTAPSISRIAFVNVPDTLHTNQPLTVRWTYPPGETNDSALLFIAGGYVSGLLDPGTTSHTIPANTFRSGSVQFELFSIRYMLFPNLRNPKDSDVRFMEGLDHRGSFFGMFVGVNRYVEVI